MAELVRVNELGLVIPPQRLDCIGEHCPVTQQEGNCFSDDHHLYWPRKKFRKDRLAREFRNHPLNQVKLVKCQHNSSWSGAIHKQYDGAPMPRQDIMERFLEEAKLLTQIGNISVRSNELLGRMEDVAPQNLDQQLEQWYEYQQQIHTLGQKAVTECEVVTSVLDRIAYKLPASVGSLLLQPTLTN